MDLFLDDILPVDVKKRVAERIREVEGNLSNSPLGRKPPIGESSRSTNPLISAQAPSMQRLMEQNQDLIPQAPQPASPAAAQALAQRAALLQRATSAAHEKPEPGMSGPRKF